MSPDQKPQVLWRANPPIGPQDLTVTVMVDNPPVLPDPVTEAIEESWQARPRPTNGLLASLIQIETGDHQLHLITGLTDYKTQVGTSVNYNDPRIQRYPECLRYGCLVLSTLIFTSDNYLVLGLRPKGNSTIPGIIEGTANRDESAGPLTYGYQYFQLIANEIKEELGCDSKDIRMCAIGLVSLLVNCSSRRPLLLFTTHTQLHRREISQKFEEKGNKAEHRGLLFIPNTVESVTRFLAEHPTDGTTTLATIDSLLYYLDYPNGYAN